MRSFIVYLNLTLFNSEHYLPKTPTAQNSEVSYRKLRYQTKQTKEIIFSMNLQSSWPHNHHPDRFI